MHNPIAYDIFVLVTGSAALAVLFWQLADSVRRGRVPLRFGGHMRRERQPVLYWSMMSVTVGLAAFTCMGIGVVATDLFLR